MCSHYRYQPVQCGLVLAETLMFFVGEKKVLNPVLTLFYIISELYGVITFFFLSLLFFFFRFRSSSSHPNSVYVMWCRVI